MLRFSPHDASIQKIPRKKKMPKEIGMIRCTIDPPRSDHFSSIIATNSVIDHAVVSHRDCLAVVFEKLLRKENKLSEELEHVNVYRYGASS